MMSVCRGMFTGIFDRSFAAESLSGERGIECAA